MNEHLTGDAAVAAALAHLLTDHPQLSGIIWPVGERPGVLLGYQMSQTGQGEIVDTCAGIMGGTVARTSEYRQGDKHGVAQLVTTFDGVPVHVWASYVVPSSDLTGDKLRDILAGPRDTAEGGEDQ
ncbi:hypothetical protein ACFY64_31420 [Streptomyces collinus]|uniref:hypothetical protein n=1 Tax=Streptomyces collinus TaxID=42684 RepID=UPI0036BB6740